MKKCLNGFLVMLMILICPTLKANALTMEELPELPTEYSTNYYEIVTNSKGDTYLYFYEDQYLYTINGVNNSYVPHKPYTITFGGTTTGSPVPGFPDTMYSYTYQLNKTTNTWEYKGYSNTPTMYTAFDFNIYKDMQKDPTAITPYLKEKVIYTNVNHFYTSDNGETFIQVLSANDYIKEYLRYSYNQANDLDGIDIYNFRFNAINYNHNYKYLIKTSQETEWTNITEELNNEANQYDYILYYNTTIHMQVLDENNEILETKTQQVTDLTDYGFKIKHAPANDLNNRYVNTITIDTRFIYQNDYKYQYSFDNQVFYDMNITEENKIFYLNHGVQTFLYFRVLNAGNNVVYNQKYEEIFDGLIKHVHVKEDISNNENGEKQILIKVDFSEYLEFNDMYNFRILINDVEYTEQDFIIDFTLNKNNFDNFKEIEMKVYIDNFLVDSSCYYPNNGQIGFDNKYNNILEEKMENEIKNNEYTSISGMVEAVKNFINAIGEFVTNFFDLIMYFFNKLNIWIRTCIIALFIELVIFKTIKVVRKK